MKLRTGKLHIEPVWRQLSKVERLSLPPALLTWLIDKASLTQRLQGACRDSFRVELVAQNWSRPLHNESQVLRTRSRESALVRLVRLYCDGHACVFARTVIPAHTFGGSRRRLARLGSRPLGAILFADPTMHRSEVEIARITPGHHSFDMATSVLKKKPEEIWGRRSIFFLHSRPLLVSEIFLPPILEVAHNGRN